LVTGCNGKLSAVVAGRPRQLPRPLHLRRQHIDLEWSAVSDSVPAECLQCSLHPLSSSYLLRESGRRWAASFAPRTRLSSILIKSPSFGHLRHLDFIFPCFGDTKAVAYCATDSGSQQDWISALNSVKDSLTLSRLSVRVSFGIHPYSHPSGWGEYRREMTQEQRQQYKDCYVSTISPLRAWRGLARFYVHLTDPQKSCWWSGESHDTALERKMEKWVMGPDYEAEGKSDMEETLLEQWDGASMW